MLEKDVTILTKRFKDVIIVVEMVFLHPINNKTCKEKIIMTTKTGKLIKGFGIFVAILIFFGGLYLGSQFTNQHDYYHESINEIGITIIIISFALSGYFGCLLYGVGEIVETNQKIALEAEKHSEYQESMKMYLSIVMTSMEEHSK